MNVFFAILKCELSRLFNGGRGSADGKRKIKPKRGLAIALVALAGAFIAVMSAFYSFLFAVILSEAQMPLYPILAVFMALYLILALTFCLTSANGTVFGGKDYEILMSFPVRPSFAAIAKSAYVYAFLLGLAVVIVLPSACVCSFFSSASPLSALAILSGIIALPLLPLGIGLAIGSLVAILMARVKRKNIARLIFSLIGVVAYIAFLSVGMGDIDDEQIAGAFLAIEGVLAPVCFLAKGILGGGFLQWITAILLPAAVSALYYLFISKNYKKVNTLILTKRSSGDFKMKEQKQSSLLKCTFLREVKMWAACPGAIINNLIGPLLTFVLALYVLINGGVQSIFGEIAEEDLSFMLFYVRGALPLVPVFFVSVSTYTSAAVSLEGKSLWIIKSLPLDYRDFLKPKLLLGLIISLPFTAAAEVALGATLQCNAIEIIISLLFLIAYCVAANLFGLYIGLRMPFLDWKNPAEAIKRGGSVAVCSIVGMLVIIPFGAIAAVCMAIFHSYYLAWGLCFALLAIILVVLVLLFKNNGEKLYHAL